VQGFWRITQRRQAQQQIAAMVAARSVNYTEDSWKQSIEQLNKASGG
jgi:hypothetical protein